MEKSDEKLAPPSEEFMDAVCHSGSIVINCDLCGRVHFASDAHFDFEEGELEDLLRKQKENPDKYINHNESSVSWGHLAGKQVVYDCPCNRARTYEDVFWHSRYVIADYFSRRAKLMVKQAETQAQIAKSVSQSVNPVLCCMIKATPQV